MPFQASSLAIVQSTFIRSMSPVSTQGRGRLTACCARIFCVNVIGFVVCFLTILLHWPFALLRCMRLLLGLNVVDRLERLRLCRSRLEPPGPASQPAGGS